MTVIVTVITVVRMIVVVVVVVVVVVIVVIVAGGASYFGKRETRPRVVPRGGASARARGETCMLCEHNHENVKMLRMTITLYDRLGNKQLYERYV